MAKTARLTIPDLPLPSCLTLGMLLIGLTVLNCKGRVTTMHAPQDCEDTAHSGSGSEFEVRRW